MLHCFFLFPFCSSTDIIFAGKASALASGPCKRSHSRNSSSESQSPGLSGSSNSAVGISEFSAVTIEEFEYDDDSLDKTATHESQGALRHKKRRQTPVQGSICPTSHDLQNLNKLDNDENLLLSDILSNQNEKSSIDANKVGSFVREKRLRKRTQRFIEEFSDKKSKYFKGRGNFSSSDAAAAEDKGLKVRSSSDLRRVRARALSSVPEKELLCGTQTQEVCEFRARRGRPKKHVSTLVSSFNSHLLFQYA